MITIMDQKYLDRPKARTNQQWDAEYEYQIARNPFLVEAMLLWDRKQQAILNAVDPMLKPKSREIVEAEMQKGSALVGLGSFIQGTSLGWNDAVAHYRGAVEEEMTKLRLTVGGYRAISKTLAVLLVAVTWWLW